MEKTEIKPEVILKSINEGGGTGMLRYNLGVDENGKQCYKFTNCDKDLSVIFESFSFLDAFKLWEEGLKRYDDDDVMLNWFYRFSPYQIHVDYKTFIENDLRNRLIKYPNQKPRSLARWAKLLNVSIDFLLGNE